MCNSIESKPMRSARLAASTKASRTCAMSASSIARGAGHAAPGAIAEGPIVGHGSWPGFRPSPPSHGRAEEALRPACASWMPNFAVPMRLQCAMMRANASSQESE